MDSSEIICNCMQITLEEIIEAINSGATFVDLLQETTGIMLVLNVERRLNEGF